VRTSEEANENGDCYTMAWIRNVGVERAGAGVEAERCLGPSRSLLVKQTYKGRS
jgi:hypothetical protein